MSEMLADLKAYVGGEKSNGLQNQSDSTVRLTVTHSNLITSFPELRVDLHMTVESLKDKIYKHCGTMVSSMILHLKDPAGRAVCTLGDDYKMLGYYSPTDGYIVHVEDTDPYSMSANGGLENVNLVEKYEISDEDYMKRDDNYRKWKKDKLDKDPTWTLEKETHKNDPDYKPKESITDADYMADLIKPMNVGDRCEVSGGRRGEVKYLGKCVLGMGFWVGVAYDEPVGKNDGSVRGTRYFEADEKYGGMVRPNLVEVGDYPEEDLFSDSSDDEI